MRCIASFSVLVLTLACHGANPAPSARATAPAKTSASPAPNEAQALRLAEARRDSASIGSSALSSRELPVRRAAARALARIADARAVELLSLALGDEDPVVISWSAYGLGYACRGHEPKTVRALVARAASLTEYARGHERLADPNDAIADALGRCGGPEAELTLRAWLVESGPRAEAAALGLGRLATERGQLDDDTLVALLEAAARPNNPVPNALYPCTRLTAFNASTSERLRALAQQQLARNGPELEFAVRALGRTGDAGRAALGALLNDTSQPPDLRAEATRELSGLGTSGQPALWAAFDALTTATPSDPDVESASFGAFSALIDALALPILGSSSKLQSVAELAIGSEDAPGLRRRKVHLRCTAAALLAGSNYQNARLLACDSSSESPLRELTVLQVIAREKLRGSRKQAYLRRAESVDDILRGTAVGLLAEHAELSESYRVLSSALTSQSVGVVANAARVLSSYPERATRDARENTDARDAPNPDPSVVHALAAAYAATSARHNVEVQSLLLDAMGALRILSAKEALSAACTSDNPTLREHAEKSLRLLGEQGRRCDKFTPQPSSDADLASPVSDRTVLTFDTDAGSLTLTLDATFAPSAVARIAQLARAGFYDGSVVHRVVPGFVAQFGDPTATSYGGDDQPPLRCETSPIAFGVGSVGVALGGRDTGSSQLFVTLGRYPHLDGEYAWLGQAGPGWDRVAQGDRVLRVHVSSTP